MINIDTKNIKWVNGWRDLPEAWVKIKTPGVTSIINEMIPDPEMEEWVRKMGQDKVDEILKNAGYRGTAMHIFIENFINVLAKTRDPGKALEHTQKISPKLLLEEENIPQYKIDEGRELFYKFYYSEFANTYNNLIKTELGIYSSNYFYRGKADVFYNDKIFGPSVTDFKTSSGYIKKGSVKELKYKYQLGAYSNALDEMYKSKNIIIKKSSILCINTKTNDLQEIVVGGSELEKYKQEFKTIAKDWHVKNNQEYLIK